MKQFIILLVALSSNFCLNAQSPAFFNYQGMAIDKNGVVIENQSIELRLTIFETSPNGSVVFQETHQVQTSRHGIFSIQVGKGNISQGQLSNVKWQSHVHWLETEIDYSGQGFTSIGLDQFVSVPYAMHAETVTNADDADADPQNEIQSLSINGNQLSISGGNSVTIPTSGGSGDDDSTNEIQDLSSSKNGSDITVNISRNGQSTTFSVDDTDADPQNEIQSLSFANNTLSLSGANNVDLSSYQSRWKNVADGIQFDEGLVRILDQNTNKEVAIDGNFVVGNDGFNSYELLPESISWGRGDRKWASLMDAIGVDIYNPSGPERMYITKDSTVFTDSMCTTTIKPGVIVQNNEQNLNYTSYSKDSLYFFETIGLLYPDIAVMKPTHIEFKTWGTDLRSTMGPGVQRNYSSNYWSEVNSNEFRIWETSQPQSFQRVAVTGDSLNLWNSAKWRTIDIQSDTVFGGTIDLHGPSGTNLVELGARRDTTFGNLPGGNLFLKDYMGKLRNTVGTFGEAGYSILNDDSTYVNSINGTVSVGCLIPGIDFDLLDPRGSMGVDLENKGGYVQLRGGPSATKTVFLGSDLLDPKGGRLCLFNNDDDNEKVCAVANELDGGELYLFGKNSAKFYAGGYNDRGMATVADSLGFEKAGMIVEEWDEGKIFVETGGRFAIQDEQGFDRMSIFQDNLYFSDSTGGTAVALGQDFAFSNVGYQYLYGRNGYANVFLGHDRNEGEIGPSGNFGLIEAKDDLAITRSWMSGTGEMGCGGFVLRDYNESNKILAGTLPWNSSSWMDFYGSNGGLNATIGSTTDGDFGNIQVYDNAGVSQAGLFVDEVTGQGHLFADVKNFRIDHPENSDKEIWYASLEGPEAAAYVRGTYSLDNGEAFVAFPEHFSAICNSETITIQLTPRHWDTYGLALIEVTTEGFRVKELKGGQGEFEFDWEAKGVRKGHENYKAVLSKAEVASKLNPNRSAK